MAADVQDEEAGNQALADARRCVADLEQKVRELEQKQSTGPLAVAGIAAAPAQADVNYCFEYPTAPASDSLLSTNGRWCGPCVNIFPTHDPTSPPRVFKYLQPSEQDIADVIQRMGGSYRALCNMSVVSVDGVSVLEKSPDRAIRTVQSEVMKSNNAYQLPGVQVRENKPLRILQQPVVYCKLDNKPDIAWVAEVSGKLFVVAVQEVKRAFTSPVNGLQQVATYTCAAAAGMYNAGVDHDKILVPMSVCTGLAEVHGAAFMATPSFPVAVSTSAVLDLRTDQGAARAHLHRSMAKKQMERSLQLLDEASAPGRPTRARSIPAEPGGGADETPWFRPSFAVSQVWPKLGGVSHGLMHGRDVTLLRMGHVFQKLYASPASRFVCFPICFANNVLPPPLTKGGVSALLFPNLMRDGYRCGLPEDLETARMYISAVKEAMIALHEAGVIHGDMYISNIMWRRFPTSSSVDVKLIDWDTAFLAQDGLPDGMERAWKTTCKWCLYQTRSTQVDDVVNLRLLDSFMVNTLEHFCVEDTYLWREWMKAAGDKPVRNLNSAFRRMQCLYVRHNGWPEPEVCRVVLGSKDEQVAVRSSETAAAATVPAAEDEWAMGSVGDAARAPPAKKSRPEASGLPSTPSRN